MKSLILCDNSEPEKVLPLCNKYNLGIEIQGFSDPNKTEKKEELIKTYKDILPQNGERYLHAPFWDLCLGSNNKKIVEVTRYFFDFGYDIANELDCLGIIVHHGFIPNTSYPANWIKRSVLFWQDFFNAHPGNIKMFMENQCEQDTETLTGIIDTYQCNRLSINLDIGHAHCNSNLPVIDWIKQLNKRIQYVHLHQNHGVTDEHLGLWNGNIPIKEALNALNKYAPEATWALECNLNDIEDSILLLREYGYI